LRTAKFRPLGIPLMRGGRRGRHDGGLTRFLIATMPAAGHVGPLVPIASELLARGHSADWYTGTGYRAKVEATGATFHPHVHAPDRDVARLPVAV
jgi:hypothetical protein